MAKQLLENNGFENDLDGYIIQGSVSTNSDFACSGQKSALLLATPTAIAEMSQVVFFISPGSPVNFSFFARRFLSENVENVSNFRIEVNFISFIGTVIPPGIVIKGRGRDISEKVWKRYNGYAVAPFGTTAAQVVIRLEPPADGTSGLLVDDLELLSEVTMPASLPFPVQPGIPMFPNIPFTPPPTAAMPQGTPTFPGFPFAPPTAPASTAQQQNPFQGLPLVNPMFPGLPFPNLPFPGTISHNPTLPVTPFVNPAFPSLPFPNPMFPVLPSPNPAFPVTPFANPTFQGSPFPNMTPPAPASPVQQENPAFPGSLFANLPFPDLSSLLYPGSPFANLLFPGSPFANMLFSGSPFNMAPEANNMHKQEDKGFRPLKSSNKNNFGQNEN